jgi:hypothetical protein
MAAEGTVPANSPGPSPARHAAAAKVLVCWAAAACAAAAPDGSGQQGVAAATHPCWAKPAAAAGAAAEALLRVPSGRLRPLPPPRPGPWDGRAPAFDRPVLMDSRLCSCVSCSCCISSVRRLDWRAMDAAHGSRGRLLGARPKPMGGSAAAGVETLAAAAAPPPPSAAVAASEAAAALDSDADCERRRVTTLVGLRAWVAGWAGGVEGTKRRAGGRRPGVKGVQTRQGRLAC